MSVAKGTEKRMSSAASALLDSMKTVQQALAQSPSTISPQQLSDRVQEWRQLVQELVQESAQGITLAALYDITRMLNTSLNLKDTLGRVMDSLIQLTGAERSCLMLLNDHGRLTIEAARQFDQERVAIYELEISQTVVRDVIKDQRPIVTTNAQLDPRFSSHESVVEYQLRSIACVPLQLRDRVIGALYLDNRMRAGVFSESDLPMLTMFASHAAVAIENARLYDHINRHAAELSNTVHRLQELDRLKDEFIQNVSHELRTPLSVIQGYATLLDAGELGALQPEQREPVAIINRRVKMLSDIVEDITLILGTESSPLKPERVRLDELAQSVVETFRFSIQQAGLTLRTDIPSCLAPVNGSPVYLRRVLNNLLSNAIKFTPAGGTISVRLREENGYVILQVSDTGIGIPANQHKYIFDRFYQVDGSPQRCYGGMGLGLALVKEVVELHGGSVSVASEKGQGSVFTVILPCASVCTPAR